LGLQSLVCQGHYTASETIAEGWHQQEGELGKKRETTKRFAAPATSGH